jgi:hypothetical protein
MVQLLMLRLLLSLMYAAPPYTEDNLSNRLLLIAAVALPARYSMPAWQKKGRPHTRVLFPEACCCTAVMINT